MVVIQMNCLTMERVPCPILLMKVCARPLAPNPTPHVHKCGVFF